MDEQYRLKKYTAAEMEALLDKIAEGTGYTKSEIDEMLTEKVDVEEGKGLSTNDFTDSDKAQISANKAGIGAVANAGSKNLLPIKNHAIGDVTEANGFRFTVQADGGILIEDIGTHSNNGDYYLIGRWGNTETLIDCSDTTYTATLEANDNTVSKVSLRIYKAGTSVLVNNVYANTSANFTGEIAFIFITAYTDAVIPSGGVVVYPMIRNAAIEDNTYVPYGMTNAELTKTKANQAETTAIVNRGSKNLLKIAATTQTINGVTFTVNSDDTITINGTATAAATFTLATASQINSFLPLGTYKLSGCTGGSTTTYDMRFYHPGDSSTVLNHNGDTQFTRDAIKTDSNISILVRSGQVMDNVVIKPMIRDAAIEDDTYQPYSPTNRELYEAQNRIASETLSYRYDVISTWTWTALYQSNNLKYYTNIPLTGWDEIYSVGIANSTHIGTWMIYIESFRANRIQIGLIDLTGTGTAPNITDNQIGIDVCIYGKKST